MSLDLILEFVHHLAVFSLVGVFFAEFFLLTQGDLRGARLATVGQLDAAYGGLAGLIVIVGVARVIWGDAGWQFYVMNWAFWVKMALFLAVGLLSIQPTRVIIGWRKAASTDTGYTVPQSEIGGVRGYFLASFAALALIPIFAAVMARGIGL
jgi:putative membrane protein